MRILDEDNDVRLDNICVFLTQNEIIEMIGCLNNLLNKFENSHVHMSSLDYQKEITICKYDINNLSALHDRAKKLIIEDK